MKKFQIGQILTNAEIKKAFKLKTASKIAEEIIRPNIARINAATGQENDPAYLGYAVEYAIRLVNDSAT